MKVSPFLSVPPVDIEPGYPTLDSIEPGYHAVDTVDSIELGYHAVDEVEPGYSENLQRDGVHQDDIEDWKKTLPGHVLWNRDDSCDNYHC